MSQEHCWCWLITVDRRSGAFEDEFGHRDAVAEGVVHAGQLLAEALQHGGDHGVELPGEVVRQAEAAGVFFAGIEPLRYRPLVRAAPDQRWAQHAELRRPGGVKLLACISHLAFRNDE